MRSIARSVLLMAPLLATSLPGCEVPEPRANDTPSIARPEDLVTAYRIQLEAKGIAGARTPNAEPYLLYVSPGALKLAYVDGPREIIFKLDEKVIYELDTERETFTKQTLDSLALDRKRQKDREKKRQRIMKKAEDAEERKRMLKKLGLRADGKTIIEVEETGESKPIAGHTCHLYRIMENGVPIVRIWAAAGLERPKGLNRFFAETGIFSEEMVGRIASIGGFPMGLEVEMDYSLIVIDVEMLVTSFEATEISPSIFEVPEGMVEVKEAPAVARAKCPVCENEVDRATALYAIVPQKGKYFYDRAVCKEKDRDRVLGEILGE